MKAASGATVDATRITVASSTTNRAKAWDLQIDQTRKGRQWCFGLKLQVGVDSKTKLIHSLMTTAANMHDWTALCDLLHCNDMPV